ncbi:MAG: hypothetical protein JXR05_14735 [Flavobacteriaceae bacterium]
MKKEKFKNCMKLGVFLFGISIMLWNCEKEESLELQSTENGNPFIKRAKLTTLEDLSSFVVRVQKGNNNLSKNSLEDANDFTILENRDVFIYTDSISTTYTLAIRKSTQEPSSFSNLIVKFEEGVPTKASILNYVPTQQYLTAYNLDKRTPFEGTVAYESLHYNGSLDHLDTKVVESCYTYTITYCDAPANWGAEGYVHVATEGCNPNHMWTERYTVCPEPTEIVPPDPDDPNGGGGGDSVDGTTAPIPPCESTGSDTGIVGADSDCTAPRIINDLTDECAKNIFNQLMDGIYEDHPIKPELQVVGETMTFAETIINLFNDSANTNYTIQNGPLPDDENASTVITTTTISNSYLSSATTLSIARTMIHELVHAYLNGVFYGFPDIVDLPLNEKLHRFAIDNGYTSYIALHHDFMGQYINAMAYSLYEWDKNFGSGGNFGWNYYYSMSFIGLFTTDNNGIINSENDTFITLIPNASERQNIATIVFNELKGNNAANGQKCN